MDPFIGQICLFPYNFAPRGWAFCSGQLMSIAQNTALFSLLGTTYGGDGRTTFALPDLRGRAPIHYGSAPGLQTKTLGEKGGVEQVALLMNEMPQHNYVLTQGGSSAQSQTKKIATENFLQNLGASDYDMEQVTLGASGVNPMQIGIAGGSQPHNNMSPYLVLNYCIATQGIFPSRD